MDEDEDVSPMRTQLSNQLLTLAVSLHWALTTEYAEARAIELCRQMIDKVNECESVMLHVLRERPDEP